MEGNFSSFLIFGLRILPDWLLIQGRPKDILHVEHS